ncbi:hypothetical protein GCM10010106_40770 [Thermopolyspora flexuosa]|jgi:ribosome-associated protein|uniref:Ribosome-associated protein n=1 Tax=Thermopolyspora flexuosa TaxID=103836 RepID=A0A543IUE0_9ACTN|nr:RNA-binding S4 domain-containing protein [Thermopolyspora flexuosa]TQM74188.1 ribosome-associated protein [Thermopolyspora flexuosa]GGM89284.1 hypothetical protein GCM10010106_40770 [Thermopolyspora flexuosa]
MPFVKETYRLRTDFIPLCDLLKVCGVTDTGGEAGLLIASGEVYVDGEVEQRKRRKVRAGQLVTGENFEIRVIAPDA